MLNTMDTMEVIVAAVQADDARSVLKPDRRPTACGPAVPWESVAGTEADDAEEAGAGAWAVVWILGMAVSTVMVGVAAAIGLA